MNAIDANAADRQGFRDGYDSHKPLIIKDADIARVYRASYAAGRKEAGR
jgi:hypothetical protein